MRTIVFSLLLVAISSVSVSSPVDPDAQNGLASLDRRWALLTDGRIFELDGNDQWIQRPNSPVPITEITEFWMTLILTNEAVLWEYEGDWHIIPNAPWGQIVSSDSESLGGVKGMFR